MHLRYQGQRLRVCSGYQGRQEVPPARYVLATPDAVVGTSSSATTSSGGSSSATVVDNNDGEEGIAHWLRTFDPDTGRVRVGVLHNDIATDVPLGFLGATATASDTNADGSNTVLGDMAAVGAEDETVRFFRCADRLACRDPAFTYNGLEMASRLDPVTLQANFSETSLRLCGAIGSVLLSLPSSAPLYASSPQLKKPPCAHHPMMAGTPRPSGRPRPRAEARAGSTSGSSRC